MTTSTSQRRPRWPWIVGILAAVVVIAIIVGVSLALSHPAPGPTSTQTHSPTRTTAPGAAPTGCLGGSGRDNAMLLAAQKAASHSQAGAVELGAAFVRWTFRHPTATSDEASQIATAVISDDASASFKDLAAAVAANPNPSGGAVADGTDFYVSTTPGVWYVDSASANRVTVSIGAGYVIDGAVNPQLRTSSTFTLVWQHGAWRVQAGSLNHTTEELFRIGTPFTEGC